MKNCCNQGTKNYTKIEESIELLKAVSDPNRLRVLCALSKTEICVCKLAEKLNISRNLLSFHLKTLFDSGILDKKRVGNQIFFYIKDEWKGRVSHFFSFVGIK